MALSLVSLANMIGGNWWPYILEAIFFLLVVTGFAIQNKNHVKGFSYFAYGITILFVMRAVVFTLILYKFWSDSVPGKYFLPPYQPISYFAHYSLTHFYFSLLLTLAATYGISFIFLIMQKYGSSMFLSGDIALYVSCCMLIRWPLLVPYTFTVFATAVLFVAMNSYIIKVRREISLYPFFLIVATPFIFFGNTMLHMFHLQSLLFPL